jgi:hypothetical protein
VVLPTPPLPVIAIFKGNLLERSKTRYHPQSNSVKIFVTEKHGVTGGHERVSKTVGSSSTVNMRLGFVMAVIMVT